MRTWDLLLCAMVGLGGTAAVERGAYHWAFACGVFVTIVCADEVVKAIRGKRP